MKLFLDDVILEPIISEKALNSRENENKYVFVVHPKASKSQIKKAVEIIFKVKVKKVNTILVKPKPKRNLKRRFSIGYTSSYKKAIVTLEKGQRIDLEV